MQVYYAIKSIVDNAHTFGLFAGESCFLLKKSKQTA